jgi:ABC-2 type transport system permease protein
VKVLFKLTWIEIKLLAREPVTLLFSFAFPVLVLVLLGGIFGSQHMKQGAYQGVKMMDWYVPAFIGLVIASIGTISLPVHLSSYRERGVLRRFRASGVSEAALLGSQLMVSLGVALVGALTIAFLGILAYGANPATFPAGVALAYVVGVFCFSGIGVLLASIAPTARAAQSVGLLLWFIMLFVSGTSAPLDLLPNWMVDIGKALPLYHLVIALVDPWIGRGVNWMQLGIVAVVGLVTTLLSLRVFRWE